MSDPQQTGPVDPEGNPWTRRSRVVAYQNPWIVVYHDEVIRPDGQPGIYGVVHYKNRAVGIVAVDEQDRVALVGQYRYTLSRYSWEIPEGGADEGEEPLEAAKRELLEETGCSARHWQPLLLHAFLSNSVSDEEVVCFLATDLQMGQPAPEGTERLQLRWLPFREVMRLIERGEITDAISILAMQCLALGRLSGPSCSG
jgi:8-oxo-dGTP pyrophosphatase MutT (NUDIX family)